MYLNCHTYFSFKYGTLSPEQLLQKALQKGVNKFVLTDINNTSAWLDTLRRSQKLGIEPVPGIDFRNGSQQQFIGIAQNNAGFKELNEFLIQHLHANTSIPDTAPEFNNAFVVYPFRKQFNYKLRDNEYLGVKPSQVKQLLFSPWKEKQHKLVILQPVTFATTKDFNTHKLLRAIDKNALFSWLKASELAESHEIMVAEKRLEEIFIDYPDIIRNTKKLLHSCSINIEFEGIKNKKYFSNSINNDVELIRNLCLSGINYRYGKKVPTKVVDRMEKELKIITEKQFASYYLINWDMVNFARQNNFYYVGRGSGANSLVAYLLRITDVDPIELDLYFERFINPERTNLPDFDIDFSSLERDYITRYLFEKYGADKVALVGAYSTFKESATVRELGKVFGLPAHEISRLQNLSSNYRNDEVANKIYQHYNKIAGLPSHLTVHSSGILISEEPISCYTATMMPPKGYPTTHFSMLEAEDIGLHKFDILAQRGLGKIKDSVALIKENRGVDVNIHEIEKFKNDDKINQELLKSGKTIGCFYVESPAMRMLLTKLNAQDYLRLVAASSIIRPGVAQSGMMHEYILRFHDKIRRKKAQQNLPELYNILKETYGVMVYQEDVIKVAHIFAGLSLAEADILRRGMSWKFRERNEFHKIKDKFIENCRNRKHKESTIQKLWLQIESFGNYAFAKGHSASYAVESYQALYLKAHYPFEYLVATVNNGGGFYKRELYLHEAKMLGATIELPCVNTSNGMCSIAGETIYIGLGFIAGLELKTVNKIIGERSRNGRFENLRDFICRVCFSLEQLRLLIRVGAFRFTGKPKKELLWEAHFLLSSHRVYTENPSLFNLEPKEFVLPELWVHPLENAFDEIELLGFPITTSAFELIENLPEFDLLSSDLHKHIGEHVSVVANLIHIKHTQTRAQIPQAMYFGTWLDRSGNWLDTVHFPTSATHHPFRGPGCYIITGKVTSEFDFITIEVSRLKRLHNKSLETPSVRQTSTRNTPKTIIRNTPKREKIYKKLI